ncbi:MAG: 30S ribosomal protein S6--L-glutamate ligase [bacterium]|nr:30S ribosomal protein S6--L-glutamate ligase [bacterium]
MKIAILSRGRNLYSTRRLHEAAKLRGHQPRVLDTLKFAIDNEEGEPDLTFRGKSVSHYDAVIPRIGASITLYGTAVVRQFEQMGVFCLNSSQAISVSRDKLRSMQILSRHKIGIPKTAFVHELDQIVPTIDAMGGPPVVIKLLEGTQGIGVILADTASVAKSIIEVLQGAANQNVLIQEFVKESRGRDIRAFVVGNRVVAAMRRVAQGDEFRSNVHRGGIAEPVDLDPEFERTALHAAQIMGLRVAGVDMLEGKDGPKLMEINSSPGLEGIEAATGVDVAGAVIELIEEEVLFPEIDIRQRLTLQSGYGVLEVPVDEKSELANRAITDTGLRDRDVVVLSIHRGPVSIPNPKGSREILPGDTLLCFGKTLTLKSLAPRGPKRRRKKKRSTSLPASGADAVAESAPAVAASVPIASEEETPSALMGDEPVAVVAPAPGVAPVPPPELGGSEAAGAEDGTREESSARPIGSESE